MSRSKHRAVTVAAATGLLALSACQSPAEPVSAELSRQLEDSVARTIATVHTFETVPVKILEKANGVTTTTVASTDDVDAELKALADVVPMTGEAQDQVKAQLADERRIRHAGSVVATTVSANKVSITRAKNGIDYVVEASDHVTQTDTNGVTTETMVLSRSVYSSDHTLMSFHVFSDEDLHDGHGPSAELNGTA